MRICRKCGRRYRGKGMKSRYLSHLWNKHPWRAWTTAELSAVGALNFR